MKEPKGNGINVNTEVIVPISYHLLYAVPFGRFNKFDKIFVFNVDIDELN